MELVEIISVILLYGSGLLVFVIVISFVLSKTKTEEEHIRSYQVSPYKSHQINPLPKVNNEQAVLRKNQTISYPQIFRLENIRPKEIKIVRKSTVTKRESQEALRFDPKHLTRANGNGIRYTIVNENLKKKNLSAANFYI
jgi:hypothetical protein